MTQNIEKAVIKGFRLIKNNYSSRVTSVIFKKDICISNNIPCRTRIYGHPSTTLSFCVNQNAIFYVTAANNKCGDPNRSIIYFGEYGSKIKGVKVMSYSSSLITILVQPYFYDAVVTMAIPATAALYTILGFFTFVTPFLIHSITKKYVTEMTYDAVKDLYTLKTLTFFLQDQIVSFKLDDVTSLEAPSIFYTLNVKGKPYMIFRECFLDENHYIKMMGYDKPIDLKLEKGNTGVGDNSNVMSESQN